jgi:hypothetical protein
VEELWGVQGATDRVIEQIEQAGCLVPCARVCEIGPGTGRYLERVLQRVNPRQYDIYEIGEGWAKWLVKTYGVTHMPTDGHTLRHTPDGSCGLIHAHGVFIYLNFLNAFEYFGEMVRVGGSEGTIVFDYYPPESFDEPYLQRWLSAKSRYPVILPANHIHTFFDRHGYQLVHQFDSPHGQSFSRYLVFRRTAR